MICILMSIPEIDKPGIIWSKTQRWWFCSLFELGIEQRHEDDYYYAYSQEYTEGDITAYPEVGAGHNIDVHIEQSRAAADEKNKCQY